MVTGKKRKKEMEESKKEDESSDQSVLHYSLKTIRNRKK